MNVTCPTCATSFAILAGLNDADARRFAKLMGEVPPLMSNELLQYFSLFKPKQQGLRWTRAVKLLNELIDDIKSEKIKHNGRYWPAPADVWKEGLETMISKQHELDLPMGNHNYLYKIMSGLSDKIEAKQEKAIESKRQNRQTDNQDKKLSELRSELQAVEALYNVNPIPELKKQIDDINEQINRHRS